MKKLTITTCLLLAFICVGCIFTKKPKVVDPCESAPKVCWSKTVGENPMDNEVCKQLIACYVWEMRVK